MSKKKKNRNNEIPPSLYLRFCCIRGECTWRGQVNEDRIPHGSGIMKFSNGYEFSGEFKNGKRHCSTGVYKCKDWSATGPWKDDSPSETGQFVIKDSSHSKVVTQYVGNVITRRNADIADAKNTKPTNSIAAFFFCISTKADEDEKDDEISRNMKYPFLNIRSYSKLDFLKHGDMGELITRKICDRKKIRVYHGGFRKNEKHGLGIFIDYKKDTQYNGTWKKNKRHGKGSLVFPNGALFNGKFENNERKGWGRYFTGHGDILEGTWNGTEIQNGKWVDGSDEHLTLPYLKLLRFKEEKRIQEKSKSERCMLDHNVVDSSSRLSGNMGFHNIWIEWVENQKSKLSRYFKKAGYLSKSDLTSSNRTNSSAMKDFWNGLLEPILETPPNSYLSKVVDDYSNWFISHFASSRKESLRTSLPSARANVFSFVMALESTVSDIFAEEYESFDYNKKTSIPRTILRVFLSSLVQDRIYSPFFDMYASEARYCSENVEFRAKLKMVRNSHLEQTLNLETKLLPYYGAITERERRQRKLYKSLNDHVVFNRSIAYLEKIDKTRNLLGKLDCITKFRYTMITECTAHNIIHKLISESIITYTEGSKHRKKKKLKKNIKKKKKKMFNREKIDDYDSSTTSEEEEEEEEEECGEENENLAEEENQKNRKDLSQCGGVLELTSDELNELEEDLFQVLFKYQEKHAVFEIRNKLLSVVEKYGIAFPYDMNSRIISIQRTKLKFQGTNIPEESNSFESFENDSSDISFNELLDLEKKYLILEKKKTKLWDILKISLYSYGADELMPCYIYCFVSANMKHFANFRFINDWKSDNWLNNVESPLISLLLAFESFFEIIRGFDPNVLSLKEGGFISMREMREELRAIIENGRKKRLKMKWLVDFFSCIAVEVGSFRILRMEFSIKDHVKRIGSILLRQDKYPEIYDKYRMREIMLSAPLFINTQKNIHIKKIEVIPLQYFGKEKKDTLKVTFETVYPSHVYEELAKMTAKLME